MEPKLYAGAARIKLDPPVGIAMAGYGRRAGRSAGVHDELAAQAIVVSDGINKAAIVSVDVLALGIRICDGIAAQVAAETDIPADAVMVCATHTHSGPAFNIFATPRDESNPSGAPSDRDLAWERSLPGRIARAVVEAHGKLREAAAAAGTGRFGLATNRRLMRTDGSVQLALNYTGAVDTELLALGIYEATRERKPIAYLVNYPCHGVMLCEDNLLYSRDWPGYLLDEIEMSINQDQPDQPCVALFAQGASGNVDPARRGTFEVTQRAGAAAAEVALRVLSPGTPIHSALIVTRRVPIRMKLRDLGAKLAIAKANLQQTELALRNHEGIGGYQRKRLEDQHQLSIAQLSALTTLDEANRRDRRVDTATGEIATHMTILAIGDIALVGLPGELFVELGMALKSNADFRQTFVLGYCNDLIGYLPTREAYAQGGYEIETSRVAEGSGELLVQEALANLSEMRCRLNERPAAQR